VDCLRIVQRLSAWHGGRKAYTWSVEERSDVAGAGAWVLIVVVAEEKVDGSWRAKLAMEGKRLLLPVEQIMMIRRTDLRGFEEKLGK
jgi:hypothetical protein